jgi:hypothetical protein
MAFTEDITFAISCKCNDTKNEAILLREELDAGKITYGEWQCAITQLLSSLIGTAADQIKLLESRD